MLKSQENKMITHPISKRTVCNVSLYYDVYALFKSINPPGSTRPLACCIFGATIISDII